MNIAHTSKNNLNRIATLGLALYQKFAGVVGDYFGPDPHWGGNGKHWCPRGRRGDLARKRARRAIQAANRARNRGGGQWA